MQWYDPFMIMLFLVGVILIGLSHHKGKLGLIGLIVVLVVVISRVAIWLAV